MFEKIDLKNGNVVARIRADFFGGKIPGLLKEVMLADNAFGYGRVLNLDTSKKYSLVLWTDDPGFEHTTDPLDIVHVGLVDGAHIMYLASAIVKANDFQAVFTVTDPYDELAKVLQALILGKRAD